MYSIYKKAKKSGAERYRFVEQVCLFGCNQGYIPKLLAHCIPPKQTEPFKWHIRVAPALAAMNRKDHALVINLKPKNAKPNLSLYELAEVWGHSASEWTPIMMRLHTLFNDEDPKAYDSLNFERMTTDTVEPVFSMTYLAGSVKNGRLTGKWTAPASSPTNSVLLWPETFEYFASEAQKVIALNKRC